MICDTPLDTVSAYKVDIIVNKKTGEKELKHRYCCSEEEYLAEEIRKKKAQEDKNRAYYLICDIMGEKEIINTALCKEWQVWNKVADNAKIAKYLEENREYLSSAIARLSSSEYARIRYLSTIIRDKIKAFVPKAEVVEMPKVVVEEHYETKYKPKTRTALLDFEEDYE
jgi:predicted nucleotidyltransferase